MVSGNLNKNNKNKMAKEIKYFMAGTDEEVLLGDTIETVLTKELKGGRKLTRYVKFELTEETLPYALALEVIEAKEYEKEGLLDFGEDNEEGCPQTELLNRMIESQEQLEKRVDTLEDAIKKAFGAVTTIQKQLNDFLANCCTNKTNVKTPSSKKK